MGQRRHRGSLGGLPGPAPLPLHRPSLLGRVPHPPPRHWEGGILGPRKGGSPRLESLSFLEVTCHLHRLKSTLDPKPGLGGGVGMRGL